MLEVLERINLTQPHEAVMKLYGDGLEVRRGEIAVTPEPSAIVEATMEDGEKRVKRFSELRLARVVKVRVLKPGPRIEWRGEGQQPRSEWVVFYMRGSPNSACYGITSGIDWGHRNCGSSWEVVAYQELA